MNIVLVGLNYRSAPVEVREHFTVPEDELEQALTRLKETTGIEEAVLVSTCNRTEVYVIADMIDTARKDLESFFASISHVSPQDFRAHIYVYTGLQVVFHLHRVVTGLDSMVLGETQILGQVRDAFLFAQAKKATGHVFNQLFRDAITFGKRVQTETGIGQSAVSVSYAAVSLAKKVFDSLHEQSVLVLGAGKMADLTVKYLQSQGVKQLFVVNRTFARAKDMAEQVGGVALPMDKLEEALLIADIVITSSGGASYLITPSTVAKRMALRKARPLFFIDIAVPRNVDPSLSHLDNVYVYDIDDLQTVVTSGLATRQQEASHVNGMIEEQVAAFETWLSSQNGVRLIASLQQKATEVQESVLYSLFHKMPDLDDKQKKIIQKHMASVVHQLLRDPILVTKQVAIEQDSALLLPILARAFGLTYEDAMTQSVTQEKAPRQTKMDALEVRGQVTHPVTVLPAL